MSANTIQQDFINKVSAQIRLSADGKDRFRCTAYGFLGHSLKQDCAIIQSH